VFYSNPADAAIDADALQTLTDAYGERATKLPPVALVIAAYNEEGAVGPVVEALPRTLCGLSVEVIIISDGCADADAEVHTVLLSKVFPRQAEVLTIKGWVEDLQV